MGNNRVFHQNPKDLCHFPISNAKAITSHNDTPFLQYTTLASELRPLTNLLLQATFLCPILVLVACNKISSACLRAERQDYHGDGTLGTGRTL